ncbi:unnamed protein product [Caenorhabditis sp. 36 PRJEB53466]|nr:unnamed protein product [Caenorhabditis sp. 36 PRJEB53466]
MRSFFNDLLDKIYDFFDRDSDLITLNLAVLYFVLYLFQCVLYLVDADVNNKRCLSVCGILTTAKLIVSIGLFGYFHFSCDHSQSSNYIFYYSHMMAPVFLILLSVLLGISAYVMCKMSFFRSAKKVLTDLYAVEENGGEKKSA